jgi:predicted RecB family nuclease
MPLPKLISKTKVMRGYQCLKNIYLTIHHPHLEPPITAEQRARFDQGTEVGIEARKRFPGGALVDNAPWDFTGSLKRTRELLNQQVEVIFEAAFEYKGLYARADIIVFSKETGRWSIYEVKSATKLKPEYIDDIRLQTWIMVNCGLPIEKISLLHINGECVHPDLAKLFVEVEVTDQVRENYRSVVPKLNEIFSALKSKMAPSTEIGSHCEEPYECAFKAHCWKEKQIPEFGVLNLPGIWERKWDLLGQGIVSLEDPRLTDLTPLQTRILDAFKNKQRYLNARGVRDALKGWRFPYVFLDFETINPAIPRFPGVRPYMQTPFQFSVHIWKDPTDPSLQHHEFLHTHATDPRSNLVEALLEACGTEGSIIAYFGQFESSRIEELADAFPNQREKLFRLMERIVDPLPILREHVYDPEFKGSFSLKKVVPAVLGKSFSYEGRVVGDGGSCQRAFEEMIRLESGSPRKEELRQAILDYCKKDTLVMVELVRWMMDQSQDSEVSCE